MKWKDPLEPSRMEQDVTCIDCPIRSIPIFEGAGFSVDKDNNGKEVRRDATITQEHRQRAKFLTHIHQQSLREERINLIKAEIERKKADTVAKLHAKLRNNFDCEKKLFLLMKVNTDVKHLMNVTMANLMSCSGDLLKVFIIVRKDNLLIRGVRIWEMR